MREHCSVRHTLTSCLSCNQLLCLFFTPTPCHLSPTGGASVLISIPCPLTRANSCALALLPLSGLSGVYLVCVPGGTARIGTSRTHPNPPSSSALPPAPPHTHPLNSSLSTTLMLSLCLNGRKALWVGNGLHQTLRGAREGVTGMHRECERERKSREEARCVCGGEVGIREGGGS